MTNLFICQIVAALILTENSGATAVGRHGDVGVLQITDGCLSDVNRISGNRFVSSDRFSKDKSIQMCVIYLSHYGAVYERKVGTPATQEVLSRIWNGGYRGFFDHPSATDDYWGRVKNNLASLQIIACNQHYK